MAAFHEIATVIFMGNSSSVKTASREISGGGARSLDRGGCDEWGVGRPWVATDSCGDDGMINSSSAIAPHPCGLGPLLSIGEVGKGPSENLARSDAEGAVNVIASIEETDARITDRTIGK